MVRMGRIDPLQVLTKVEPLTDFVNAYERFGRRDFGWIKRALHCRGQWNRGRRRRISRSLRPFGHFAMTPSTGSS